MALLYEALARDDLVGIAKHLVSIGNANALSFVAGLEARLLDKYTNKDPGVAGRMRGTKEWMLLPTDYIAVMKWVKTDAKIYRVLPSKKMTKPRPKIIAGRPGTRPGTKKTP